MENEHDKYFIIDLPPFNIGWEKRSVDVNFTLLASMEKIEQRIHPIPSDDPIQNYEHIKKKIDPLDDDITILLLPMGSKPQTLGMIWFAINAKSKNQKMLLLCMILCKRIKVVVLGLVKCTCGNSG